MTFRGKWLPTRRSRANLGRRFAAAGKTEALRKLVLWLDHGGRVEEAERLLRETIAAEDLLVGSCSRLELASLLDRHGRIGEAESLLRAGASGDEPFADSARVELSLFLERHGRSDEAQQVWREQIDAGDTGAYRYLGITLEHQGRVDDAVEQLRAGAALGDPDAALELARMLDRHGRTDEAERVYRDLIEAGDQVAEVAEDELEFMLEERLLHNDGA